MHAVFVYASRTLEQWPASLSLSVFIPWKRSLPRSRSAYCPGWRVRKSFAEVTAAEALRWCTIYKHVTSSRAVVESRRRCGDSGVVVSFGCAGGWPRKSPPPPPPPPPLYGQRAVVCIGRSVRVVLHVLPVLSRSPALLRTSIYHWRRYMYTYIITSYTVCICKPCYSILSLRLQEWFIGW